MIRWSDAVINFGSSIGIEALLQEKTLIYPGYLHSNRTIFDETAAASLANDSIAVIDYLKDLRHDRALKIPSSNIEEIYKSILYGAGGPK